MLCTIININRLCGATSQMVYVFAAARVFAAIVGS